MLRPTGISGIASSGCLLFFNKEYFRSYLSGNDSARFTPTATPGHPGWFEDRTTGCHIWDPEPEAGESMTWSGECQDGVATGPGTLRSDVTSLTMRYVGMLSNGRLTGRGKLMYSNGQTQDGEFVDGLLNGRGACNLDQWRHAGEDEFPGARKPMASAYIPHLMVRCTKVSGSMAV